MKGRVLIIMLICLLLAGLSWLGWQKLQGPYLPGYQISTQPLIQNVVATGRVAALSRAQVGSEITGVVVERKVWEGDRVQPGDVLAVLKSDELEAAVREAQAELARLQQSTLPQAAAAVREADVALQQARREVQRRRRLYEARAIPKEELERAIQAEAAASAAAEQARLEAESLVEGNPNETLARARLASAQAQLDKTVIRAQVGGTVLSRNAEPGDLVQPSRVLFEIAHDGDTEILVPLDEKNLEVLALGQSAIVIADAYPNRPFSAKVNYIAPSVDRQRGTVNVRLIVLDEPDFLREDMTVSVNIETGRRDQTIVVPNDALYGIRGDQAWVWRVHEGHAERRTVQLGLRGLAATEVVSGLQPGDRVLSNVPADIDEGVPVRVRLRAAATIASASSDEAASDRKSRNELPMRFN